jgi:hypothetical protein
LLSRQVSIELSPGARISAPSESEAWQALGVGPQRKSK